jgi:hypothetical protein
MVNHKNQILSSKTLYLYKLMFYFIFVELEFEPYFFNSTLYA